MPRTTPSTPIVETLREWTKSVRRFLVVLDQFEDYFLYNADERAPGSFDAEFPEIVNDANLRVNVLVSIREDAWARLDRFEGRIPQLFANYIRVDHLDRDAARQAVRGPIGEWNRRRPNDAAQYSIDAELIDAVVEAAASGRLGLGEQVDGAPVDAAGVETGVEAPFLQLVMDRLWTATVEDGKTALTLDRLRELGGAEQIVQSHLVDALGALNDEEQAIAAELFRFLVTRSKTKIAHPASDLAEWTKRSEPDVIAVLEQLCRGESGRILRAVAPPDGLPESTRYELFHDVLAEPILDWRKHYEQARELEQLEARRVAEEESARTAEAQRQRERRNRLIRSAAIVLLVLTAALIGVSVVAFLQRQDAIGFAHVARSQRLASLSSTKFGIDPGRALMLGAAAVSESPTEEARAAFSEALAATGIQ